MKYIKVTEEPLDISAPTELMTDETVGGIVSFIGVVRNHTKGKKVLRLEFEAYIPMAIKEMQKIADFCLATWNIHFISIHHRVGVLQIGEAPVVIYVGSAHREVAFDACEYAIDSLKKTVPIWKKEIFEDGEVWVAAHP